MSDTVTNLIRIPGVKARVVVDADYAWRDLGSLLAEGFDGEQADFLTEFATALRGGVANGLMQLQYVADLIRTHPNEYDVDAVKWLLSELLVRLEDDDER